MNSNKRKGFLELKNVQDYCKKLKHDYVELKADKENTYKAFNFFITAHHLIDWLFEGDENNPDRKEIEQLDEYKISSDISNGIKHFQRNVQDFHVKDINKERYVEEGYWKDGYVESPIYIHMKNANTKFGDKIKVIILADKIMEFWKEQLAKRKKTIEL